MTWGKLPDDDPEAIAGDGCQDDGCQDDPRAVALGQVGDHAGMITCLQRLGKERKSDDDKRKELKVKFLFSLRSARLAVKIDS